MRCRSGISRERHMVRATRRRPNVNTVDLDPRVSQLVAGVLRQADDHLSRFALLGQESVVDQRVDQATPATIDDGQYGRDHIPQTPSRHLPPVPAPSGTQPRDRDRKWMHPQTHVHRKEAEPGLDATGRSSRSVKEVVVGALPGVRGDQSSQGVSRARGVVSHQLQGGPIRRTYAGGHDTAYIFSGLSLVRRTRSCLGSPDGECVEE